MDYSLKENQVGCGWCLYEIDCKIRDEHNQKVFNENINRVDAYKIRPVLTCGMFTHYSEHHTSKRGNISKTSITELIKILNYINKRFKDSTSCKEADMARRARVMKNKLTIK